jgi:hypothetical protein
MMRLLASVLSVIVVVAAAAPGVAATAVSESDYQKLRSLQYGEEVRDAWRMLSRANPQRVAAAEAEFERVKAASGWTDERREEIEMAIEEVRYALRSAKDGEISAAELKETLAQCDPATVATVKAHLEEIETGNDSQRAEAFVREEIARERAGAVPTPAQLEGKWTFDPEATVTEMLGGLVDAETRASLKAQIEEKTGRPSYTFGPGMSVEVRTKGPDGAETVQRAHYRIDGHTLYFKGDGRDREEKLQVGMRDGKLLLGMMNMMSVFARE